MRILLYSSSMNEIGGVETFNFNYCERMSKYHELTFVYEVGDEGRIKEISKYAKTVLYTNQTFETDLCIWSTCWGKRPWKNITATTKEYWQMVHADYDAYIKGWNFKYEKLPNITRHIAVGQQVATSFEKATGYKADTMIYNLLNDEIKSCKNKIKFIVASRISLEKGVERVINFAKAFKKKKANFVIDYFGDTPDTCYKNEIMEQAKDIPEIIWHGSKADITREIDNATYLLILSDTEGCPYSLMEALQLGTPVIATDFPSAHEHIIEGKNGYILNMDLSNLDVDKIINKIPNKFKYKEKGSEQDWLNLIDKLKVPKQKPVRIKPKEIKVLSDYTDLMLDKYISRHDNLVKEYETKKTKLTQARIDYLTSLNLIKEEMK